MQDSTPDPAAMERAIDMALCRSVLYDVLAVGFRPPTPATVSRLLVPAAVAVLEPAASVLDAAWGTELLWYIRQLGAHHGDEALPRLQASFQRLFGRDTRSPVPPYETAYGEDSPSLPSQELSAIEGYLRAFGLLPNSAARERVDHISRESELLFFLASKEVYALERQDPPMQQEVQHATRLFLHEHLGRWAPAFGSRLVREDPRGFYSVLGGFCHTLVRADCKRLGVPVGPTTLCLRSPSVADDPTA